MKAAISLGRPCVLTLLLPADFENQWKAYGGTGDCQSDVVTSGYHQICLIGYTDQRFHFLNSYSDQWGDSGKGTIAWSFLDNEYEQYSAYAYTAVDASDAGLLPLFGSEAQEFQRMLAAERASGEGWPGPKPRSRSRVEVARRLRGPL